jgi:hypothetical protein
MPQAATPFYSVKFQTDALPEHGLLVSEVGRNTGSLDSSRCAERNFVFARDDRVGLGRLFPYLRR